MLLGELCTHSKNLAEFVTTIAQRVEHNTLKIDTSQQPTLRGQSAVQLLHFRLGAIQQLRVLVLDFRQASHNRRIKHHPVPSGQPMAM
ncbi:hypothetical protein D3C78_1393830 [compost metagenome]